MAPAVSVAAPGWSWKSKRGAAEEVDAETLRTRNAELEREVAALRAELEAARRRAEAAEEAEERLCVQLGEAECEAVELARAYHGHVALAAASRSLRSSVIPSSAENIHRFTQIQQQ